MSGTGIHITSARMGYGQHTILSDVELSIEKGSISCVFGRNGSGKTTFLKSVSGFLPLLNGKVEANGRDISKISNSSRARIMASVFTSRPQVSNMKVSSYVAFGRYPYSNFLGRLRTEDLQKCSMSMDVCGVTGFKEKMIGEISDGEMQKVQIARAFAQETPLLLLDEPAAHLDLVNKGEVFSLLSTIAEKHEKTILFTSHDIQFAMQLAKNFLVVKEGCIEKMTVEKFRDGKIYENILESRHYTYDADINALIYK